MRRQRIKLKAPSRAVKGNKKEKKRKKPASRPLVWLPESGATDDVKKENQHAFRHLDYTS